MPHLRELFAAKVTSGHLLGDVLIARPAAEPAPEPATFSDAHTAAPDDVAAAVDALIAEFRGCP